MPAENSSWIGRFWSVGFSKHSFFKSLAFHFAKRRQAGTGEIGRASLISAGLEPGTGHQKMEITFTRAKMLADGTRRAYDAGEAFFELGDRRGTSKVVFGPSDVTPLLVALSLESLGLMVNPVTREVLPMRLFLASSRPKVQSGRAR
jgi:hypothetical protein